MNDAELIENWLANGLSENSRAAYGNWLRLWQLYANENGCGAWSMRTLPELQGFAEWLRARRYKDLQQATDCVRSLVNFAAKTGYINENPAVLWKVQVEKHKPLRACYLDDEQIRELIEREQHPHRRIFLLFLAATGARVSEAVHLTWENIEHDEHGRCLVTILGKGQRWRVIALPLQWTVIFQTMQAQGLVRPFPWTRQWAWQLVQEAARRTGLALSPHQLRHAHITMRLKAGEDVAQIAATVGNSLQVILRYYDVNPKENITDRLPDWAGAAASYAARPAPSLEVLPALDGHEPLAGSAGGR